MGRSAPVSVPNERLHRLLPISTPLDGTSQRSLEYLYVSFPRLWDLGSWLAETYLEGSLRRAYGIYLAKTPVRNPLETISLGEITQAQLQDLIASTKELAKEASKKAFKIPLKPLAIPFPVGLGYDIVLRNSNTFIGTIMRRSHLDIPWFAAIPTLLRAVGFFDTFDDWTWWDLGIQSLMISQVKQALGGA